MNAISMNIVFCTTFCFAFVCSVLRAEDVQTNQVFVTDDGFSIVEGRGGIVKIKPEKIKESLKLRECLPAAEFREGNWGGVQSGFQLSMRLESTNVSVGNSTVATLLVRNITNHAVAYQVVNIAGRPGPVEICAEDEHGARIDFANDDLTVISAFDKKVYPNTQRKYIEGLDKRLFNKAQTIYVYASLRVGCPKCVELRSAKIPVKVE